jgi:hypothetical protein
LIAVFNSRLGVALDDLDDLLDARSRAQRLGQDHALAVDLDALARAGALDQRDQLALDLFAVLLRDQAAVEPHHDACPERHWSQSRQRSARP